MRKVRIGTKVYNDPLAGLTGFQLSEVVERATPFQPTLAGRTSGTYAPSKPVAVEIKQPGGDARRLIVKPIELTPHGFGCLVGLYLYADLDCAIHLVTHDGEHMTVSGKTENCVFLGNRAHYLGISFDQKLDTEPFFPPVDDGPDLTKEAIARSVSLVAQLIDRVENRLDHPLRADLGMILRASAGRLTGEEAMLTPEELSTTTRTAVVGEDGRILAVNPAWVMFADEAGYEGTAFTGVNYLRMLEDTVDSCLSVRPVLDAFNTTKTGDTVECRYAYSCHNVNGELDFYLVRHTAEERMGQPVVIVSHTLIESDAIDSVEDSA
jgi:hypothetical protein